jgi:hypothetical protein
MAIFTSAILIGLLSTTVNGTPTKRSICNAGRQTINGVQYTPSCGMDRLGGDYGRTGQISWGQCMAACAADSQCVTAQYHEDSQYCYFKNAANQPSISSGEDTIDQGPACQQSTTLTLSGIQCSIQCGTDRHGGDYANAPAGNYLSCAAACAADSNCVTAQYNEGNGYCYFKNALKDSSSSSDTDSIVCTRANSDPITTTTSAAATTTTKSSLKGQGEYCNSPSQCTSNICTKGYYCGPANNGSTCTRNSDCASNNCARSNPNDSFGTCRSL